MAARLAPLPVNATPGWSTDGFSRSGKPRDVGEPAQKAVPTSSHVGAENGFIAFSHVEPHAARAGTHVVRGREAAGNRIDRANVRAHEGARPDASRLPAEQRVIELLATPLTAAERAQRDAMLVAIRDYDMKRLANMFIDAAQGVPAGKERAATIEVTRTKK